MHEQPRLRVMLCSRGMVINVTRVDSVGHIRAVIWQRSASLEEGPFSFVYEEDEAPHPSSAVMRDSEAQLRREQRHRERIRRLCLEVADSLPRSPGSTPPEEAVADRTFASPRSPMRKRLGRLVAALARVFV